MEELRDAEILTIVIFAALEKSAQDMIEAREAASALDSDDVERFFDDTERLLVTPRVGADGAEIVLGDMVAASAALQAMQFLEGFGEMRKLSLILFEEIEHHTLSHLRPDGWQGREVIDEVLEGGRVLHISVNSQQETVNKNSKNVALAVR
jgi:hypothetical protein